MPETVLPFEIGGGAIRRFSDAKIGAAVDAALATIPRDKTGAVLAVADKDQVRLVAAARLGANWSVVGVLEKQWKGDLRAEAAVRFAW